MCYFFSIKIKREISNKSQLGETLNPLNNISAVSSIDNPSNLKDVFGKVDKLGDLWETGTADASLIRYIPGLSNVSRQGKIFNIVLKKRALHQHIPIKKHLSLRLSWWQIHIQTTVLCVLFYQCK